MTKKKNQNRIPIKTKSEDPPGKLKLAIALRQLLETKDFNSITTADLSKTSGVNEALIYRYYKSKRGLLHQVMEDYLEAGHTWIKNEMEQRESVRERLKSFIKSTMIFCDQNRVYAQIFILEVRNYQGFFSSPSYKAVRDYSKLLTNLINKGVEEGIFRDDMELKYIRDAIYGSIEHFIMPDVIFKRKIDPEHYTENLCRILFGGIDIKNQGPC